MASPIRRDARRYRRRILAIGGTSFGLLFVVMAPMYVDGVESDLEERVPAELTEAGFVGVTATFDGQDGTLSCEAPLPDPEAARQAAYDVWGVRAIDLDRSCRVNTGTDPDPAASTSSASTAGADDDAYEPARSDATTSAARTAVPADDGSGDDGGDDATATTVRSDGPAFDSVGAAVSGNPQLSHLAVLLQEAGLDAEFADPSADPITLFAPSDDAFESLPADVLGGLRADQDALRAVLVHHTAPGVLASGDLTDGELEMNDGSRLTVVADPLTIDGIEFSATDIDAPNGIVHIIHGVLVPDDVDPSETTVAASADAQLVGASISLTGAVSSEEVRTVLVDAASAPGLTVTDAMVVDRQAGLDRATADELATLIDVLRGNLISGRAGFDGDSLYLTGTYLTNGDRDAALAVTAEVGIEPTLTPRPVATTDDAVDLEHMLNAYVAENPILFERGRADITEESAAVLDGLVLLAQQFDEISVTVQGHTDSDGNANDNLWLSRIRARAVRDALVARGLEDEAVRWEGFGSERPVLVDDVEDKAASRRVEFEVELLT